MTSSDCKCVSFVSCACFSCLLTNKNEMPLLQATLLGANTSQDSPDTYTHRPQKQSEIASISAFTHQSCFGFDTASQTSAYTHLRSYVLSITIDFASFSKIFEMYEKKSGFLFDDRRVYSTASKILGS